MAVEIREATAADLPAARRLVEEYVVSLDVDLTFQEIEHELAEFPGEYAPPRGTILLCFVEGEALGCVCVRPLEDDCCEMKRLYVRPEARGLGAGRALAEAAIAAGRERGYGRMRLDTLPSMDAARALYRTLGFVEIDPYRFNPISGTAYMERELS